MKKRKLWLTVGIVLVFGFFKQDENLQRDSRKTGQVASLYGGFVLIICCLK